MVIRNLVVLGAVFGMSLPVLAQDGPLAGLPVSLSGEPAAQAGQAPQPHQFSVIGSVEWWRSEMDTSSESGISVSDAFVLHAATVFAFDYKNNASQNIMWGGHAGLGFENVALDVDTTGGGADSTLEGGFIFELGGDFRYTFGGSPWDVGGDLLIRFGDHDGGDLGGLSVDYQYQMIRLTAEGGYTLAPEVRLFAKLRFNGLYEGEADAGAIDFDTEIDQPIGLSVGTDLSSGPVAGGFEIMVIDVEDFGFQASLGWKF